MTADLLWKEFCQCKGIDECTSYEAWFFGGGYDKSEELACEVILGVKKETTSSFDMHDPKDALFTMPKAGDYSVITNMYDEALCVIKNTEVTVKNTIEGYKVVKERFKVEYIPDDFAVNRIIDKFTFCECEYKCS